MRASTLAAGLVLSLALACGGSHGSGPSTTTPNSCDPSTPVFGPTTPGDLEAALTLQGRTDAGFDGFFGDGTQGVFDQADSLRAEALKDATDMFGVPVPTYAPLALPTCGGSQALSVAHAVYGGLALAMTISTMATEIESLPRDLPPTTASGYRENSSGDPAITTQFTVTLSAHHSTLTADTTGTLRLVSSKDGTIEERVNVHATIDVCPDESGTAKGLVTVSLSGTATPAGGGALTSYTSSATDTIGYVLTDLAEVGHMDIASTASYRSSGGQTNDLSAHGALSFAGQALDHVDVTDLGTELTTGSQTSQTELRQNLFTPGIMAGVLFEEETRKKWRGGVCVEIKTDREGGSVKPGETLHFTATPRQKLEGMDLTVPITATLDGSSTVKPYNQPVPGPAGFDYKAGLAGQMGTVMLDSVSRRGIADTKKLTFTAGNACSIDPDTGLVSSACHWTGNLTISATGSDSHPTSSMMDGVTSTGTDKTTATYTASVDVVGGSDGVLKATGGSISGKWTHNMTSEIVRNAQGGCNFTSESSSDTDISGDVMLDATNASGFVFVFPGQYTVSFNLPTVTMMGTSHDTGSVTTMQAECTPDPPYDRTMPRTDSASFSPSVTSTVDLAHPTFSGSKTEDGTIVSTPVKVTTTWMLNLQ